MQIELLDILFVILSLYVGWKLLRLINGEVGKWQKKHGR